MLFKIVFVLIELILSDFFKNLKVVIVRKNLYIKVYKSIVFLLFNFFLVKVKIKLIKKGIIVIKINIIKIVMKIVKG